MKEKEKLKGINYWLIFESMFLITSFTRIIILLFGNPRSGMPYDSLRGVSENAAKVLVIFAVILFAYIAIRVIKALNEPNYRPNKPKKKEKTNNSK